MSGIEREARTEPAGPPPRPMVFAALALIAGQALGFALPTPEWWIGLMTSACLGWATWRYWRSRRIHGPLGGTGLALLLAILCIGWWQAQRIGVADREALERIGAWTNGEMVSIEGEVADEPRVAPDAVKLTLRQVRITSMRVGGGSARTSLEVAVTARDAAARIMSAEAEGGSKQGALPLPGQRVRAWGKLTGISTQTTPGAFNPERYALSQGLGARMTVTRATDLELGAWPTGLKARAFGLLRQAHDGVARIFEEKLPRDQVAMARALFLGDAHLLGQEERDAYSATGLAHLWAVSGLNTAFVLAILIGLTRLCGCSNRTSAFIGMAGIVFYSALTGLQPPVVRAMVMGLFILAGFTLGRVTTTLASLATAAFVTLLIDPRNLTRADWQLSYACVLAVVLITPPIYELFAKPEKPALIPGQDDNPGRWRWIRLLANQWVLLPFAGALAVQMVLMPIQLEYFGQYNLLSLPFNIVGVGLSLGAMLGVMVTAVVGWIPGVGDLAALLARLGLWLLGGFVHGAASVPHMMIHLRALSFPELGIYYGLIFCGSWLRTGEGENLRIGRRQVVGLLLTLGLAIAMLVWMPVLIPRHFFEGWGAGRNAGAVGPGVECAKGKALDLYMLDVGQGDSLVMRAPNGKVMVVDAGPNAPIDQGRMKVAPFLRNLGVGSIDCLVATHADADHIGGIPYLLEHFKVGLMVEGEDTAPSEVYRAMKDIERREGIREIHARGGSLIAGFGPAEVKLLGPVAGVKDNNGSVVLLIKYGEVEMLLAGDLESAGEGKMLEDGFGVIGQGAGVPDIEVLKLGHHGSKSSTSDRLLAAFKPEVGLISVGRRNRYGHPAPTVLRRLEGHGVQSIRTDQWGTVWVRTDGRRVWVYRFVGA